MIKEIKNVIVALEDLENSILKSYTDDRTMTEIWGWNFPPLSRNDLANLASNLATKLSENSIESLDEELVAQLEEIPERIDVFKKTILAYLFNGYGNQAIPSYISLIQWITNTLEPLFGWQILHDNKALPNQLSRRLRSIQSELNEIVPQKEELQSQIALIKNATETAETLPADLESLKEARIKVGKISTDSAELFGKIDSYLKTVEVTSSKIQGKKDEADKLVAQCEEAYKITTSKGLAGAFDERANKLSTSMWWWVIGLVVALSFGVYVGSHRFELLNEAMKSDKEVKYIWVQIFLSILSLGAPIWLAWIATKQIGQRFKLSEDYAYKASVAKAYEGYRREAAKLDEGLELRLFSSALTRLEEAPLRLMETEHHGSPWHELITSPQFKNAMDAVPELKDKLVSIIKPNSKKEVKNEEQ